VIPLDVTRGRHHTRWSTTEIKDTSSRQLMQASKNVLDFTIIGAQKAGTTSLDEYLKRHPEVYLPPGLEVAYFSDEATRERGWDDYLSKHFGSADPALKWGTATTQYMFGAAYDKGNGIPVEVGEHIVPLRIRQHTPDMRLIAILRDPVGRARSHHLMTVMNRREHRSFDEAIDELLRPESLALSRRCPEETTGYVVWGEYGRLLTGYFNIFPPEQILVVFTDELTSDPEKLLRRVYEFLGITRDFIPDNIGTRYREGGTSRRITRLSPNVFQAGVAGNPIARTFWHMLPQTGRRWVDRGFANSAYRFDLWNRSNGEGIKRPSAITLARLRQHFASDTDRLAELVGKVPPWHTG
jgi:hypothetical protein